MSIDGIPPTLDSRSNVVVSWNKCIFKVKDAERDPLPHIIDTRENCSELLRTEAKGSKIPKTRALCVKESARLDGNGWTAVVSSEGRGAKAKLVETLAVVP